MVDSEAMVLRGWSVGGWVWMVCRSVDGWFDGLEKLSYVFSTISQLVLACEDVMACTGSAGARMMSYSLVFISKQLSSIVEKRQLIRHPHNSHAMANRMGTYTVRCS